MSGAFDGKVAIVTGASSGVGEASARLFAERAVEQIYAEGRCLTRDQGGKATTAAFCDAVAQRL